MFNFNTTVTMSKGRKNDSPKIGKLLVEQNKTRKQKAIAKQMQEIEEKAIVHRQAQEFATEQIRDVALQNFKHKAIDKLHKQYPLMLAAEIYSVIASNALPHDESYVNEHFDTILATEYLYLHKLGGIEHIKKQALKENSNFLRSMLKVITENNKLITARKIKEIQNARTEDEVKSAMQLDMTEQEQDKFNNDIGKLNTDQISELVKKKVIQVVKDESKREEDNSEFIKELQNDVNDYEDLKKDKEEKPESEPGEETDEEISDTAKESSLSALAKISKYIIDKRATKESSLFFAMMQNNIKEYSALKSVKETSTKEDPTVLTSPLNLNMMDIYLKDTSGELADIDFLNINNNDPIVGDDKFELESSFEMLLSETIAQYTILECAFTTKLISVSATEVRKYANKLMGI